MAKGAPVYSCQSASCQYETPVLTRDGLIEQINASHTAARQQASQDVDDRVSAAFPSFSEGQIYDALIQAQVDVAIPVLYERDDSGNTPVYTPKASASQGDEVFVLDAESGEYQSFTVPSLIYQLGEDGQYTQVDQVVAGGSYINGLLSNAAYEESKQNYGGSSNLFADELVKTSALNESYGDSYEPGRSYPLLQPGTIALESDYNIFRDRYRAHVNALNYDSVYDTEYRNQVDGWLTGDKKILSNRQNAQGNAGVGVSTNMNVTTRDSSFQQAFIQAFN